MQHQRMEEMETQLRDRTNDALQKLENIEHNLNKEASRRQDHEQVFFEQKMVWEDKIQQMVNRQEEVVDRVEGARLVTERLASAVDAAATAQTRMALQIVELENREVRGGLCARVCAGLGGAGLGRGRAGEASNDKGH